MAWYFFRWGTVNRPGWSMSRIWFGLLHGNPTKATKAKASAAGAKDAAKAKAARLGSAELSKLRGITVGLLLCLLPFFLRKWMQWLTCEADTVGVSCMPDTPVGFAGVFLSVLALVALGVTFLDDPRKDGPYAFLCKTKTRASKKWDFYTHMRMVFLVLASFVSVNGVFQAGFALTFLLFCLVAHTFSLPYKHERTNRLETLCLLSNITMLFLGMLGAVGAYPSPASAKYVEVFGYILFFSSCIYGVCCFAQEAWDRKMLALTKQ
ncbi:unnamed protein product, partial [Chrysoparadoxa australica]